VHAYTVSRGFELHVGITVEINAQVEMKAWPRRLIPKNINATPDTWIISGCEGASLLLPSENVFVIAGFHPRKINDVVA
jgi:hypothetical protein